MNATIHLAAMRRAIASLITVVAEQDVKLKTLSSGHACHAHVSAETIYAEYVATDGYANESPDDATAEQLAAENWQHVSAWLGQYDEFSPALPK